MAECKQPDAPKGIKMRLSADYGLSDSQLMEVWREIQKLHITRRYDYERKMQRNYATFRYRDQIWFNRPMIVGTLGTRRDGILRAKDSWQLRISFSVDRTNT